MEENELLAQFNSLTGVSIGGREGGRAGGWVGGWVGG